MKLQDYSCFLSTLSIVYSIIAVFIVILRCEPITTEWATFLVSVLAIMVTLLVGFQIYSIVSIDKKIAESEKRILDKVTKSIKFSMDSIHFYMQFISTKDKKDSSQKSLTWLFKAVKYGSKSNYDTTASISAEIIKAALSNITYVNEYIKEQWLDILSESDENEYTKELYELVSNLKTKIEV